MIIRIKLTVELVYWSWILIEWLSNIDFIPITKGYTFITRTRLQFITWRILSQSWSIWCCCHLPDINLVSYWALAFCATYSLANIVSTRPRIVLLKQWRINHFIRIFKILFLRMLKTHSECSPWAHSAAFLDLHTSIQWHTSCLNILLVMPILNPALISYAWRRNSILRRIL